MRDQTFTARGNGNAALRRSLLSFVWVILAMLCCGLLQAQTVMGPWVPLFKGIDHLTGTNTPGNGGFRNQHVIHAIRVDLTDPDVRLKPSPRISNYVAELSETEGYTVGDYLKKHSLQVAINANFFDPGSYLLPAGTPMDVHGLSVSEGDIVSNQLSPEKSAAIWFDSSNRPSVIASNWPAISTQGIRNAVSGDYPLALNGENVAVNYEFLNDRVHDVHPRTAFGVSKDRRFLYLLAIDGRQPGYSIGALDVETAAWLLLLGAWDGVNLDGGGSTTLVAADSVGTPVMLNKSSAIPAFGRQRTVGSHFGVYSKPLPSPITHLEILADDTAVGVLWKTETPSTTKVEYGLTSELGESTPLIADLVTNHVAILTGLTPGTSYQLRVRSIIQGVDTASSNVLFQTTNYVRSVPAITVTNAWKYSVENLDGQNWVATSFDDSTWSGPGPGLLWVNVNPNGPGADVTNRNTELPPNPDNGGYPYNTYYFRTHFNLADPLPAANLSFSSFVDDGAVFYLNGNEISRLRMEDAPVVISNDTSALTFPCEGNASCSDDFTLGAEFAARLVPGDNLLAVEVHNYNPFSADITFGTTLDIGFANTPAPSIEITMIEGKPVLTWRRNAFILQSAPTAAGPWTDLPGPVLKSPHAVVVNGSAIFYRLRR